MTWPLSVSTDSPEATRRVGARLASVCRSGDVVLLIGELGAGKTALAQGFAAALGVEGPVTSPTFALVRQYRCTAPGSIETLIHADVYRTGSLDEVADLALAELVEERAVALVEWGDLAAPVLGRDVLKVMLTVTDDASATMQGRVITMVGEGTWADRFEQLASALSHVSSAVTP
jgi:tRNA threonylcarbamoyladenosine biosynthesis protein TsaE